MRSEILGSRWWECEAADERFDGFARFEDPESQGFELPACNSRESQRDDPRAVGQQRREGLYLPLDTPAGRRTEPALHELRARAIRLEDQEVEGPMEALVHGDAVT